MTTLIDVIQMTVPARHNRAPTKTLKKLEGLRLTGSPFSMLNCQVTFDTSSRGHPLVADRTVMLQIFLHMIVQQQVGPPPFTQLRLYAGPLQKWHIMLRRLLG